MRQIATLRVGADTDLSKLKPALYEHLLMNRIVHLDCIGEKPTYIAIRAVCFVKRMILKNYSILVNPAIVLLDTNLCER